MHNERTIGEEIGMLTTMRLMSQAYAEVAARRMQQTRDKVLKTRGFLQALADIFEDVRRSYRSQVVRLSKKKRRQRGEQITFLAHNGKTVAVLLSANTGLYGEIVRKTFAAFLKTIRQQEVEATVIGKMGQSMWLASGVKRDYTFFDLPDYGSKASDLAAIIRHLVEYERVIVFYGKFETVVRQEPDQWEIIAEDYLTRVRGKVVERRKYYFEPTLEEILRFFEAEMFAGLFEQTVRESELAKFASRMLAMDRAYEKISGQLDQMAVERLRVKHASDNRKQLNRLLGMRLW